MSSDSTDPQPTSHPEASEPQTSTPDAPTATTRESASSDKSSEAAAKRPILIGSQRDPANPELAPKRPKAVRAASQESVRLHRDPDAEETDAEELASAADAVTSTPIPQSSVPTIEDPADALQREVDAALGDMSIDDLMSAETSESSSEIEVDSRYEATVTKIHRDDVFFTLRGRFQGVASLRQFKEPPEVGASIEVAVNGYNAEDGLYELSIPGAAVDVGDWSDIGEGTVVEARITGSNTGGLECMVNNIRGFIPASQIDVFRVEDMSGYINQKLQCVVTEANPERRNLVLSHRAIVEREREEQREQMLEQLQPGEMRDGTVRKLMDFGAFVDLGGVDGLVHVSKMSWDRISHPSEVFTVGQQIKVKVESVDPQTGKISLSYRDTMEDPWETVPAKYPVSAVVQGTVSRIAQFGAFVKLEPGVEGLIHISELAHSRVFAVKNIVQEGQEVEVKVVSLDRDAQRIGLSLKATQAAPQKEEKKPEDEIPDDEPLRESVIPKRSEPLKGGRDKPSGGEQFGLKW